MTRIKKALTLLFLCISHTTIHAVVEDNAFKLYINQWENVRTLDTAGLNLEQESQVTETIETHSLTTKSGINVPITFYNRNSSVIIIAAQALPAPKESMQFLATLFPHYDILLFDYRWCNQYEYFLGKAILTREPVKRVLFDEIEELKTAVHFALNRQNYSSVVGLGECYSCFHLAKLQADSIKKRGFGPFTHLILDSCWYSLRHFAERICYDPFLPISPQVGGAPKIITWLTNSCLFKTIVLGSVFKFLSNISIQPYLSTINTPILFIHGRGDLFVPQDHFENIWQSADEKNRVLFSTPFQHADNLGNKALYHAIVEAFVNNGTVEEFEESISPALYLH